MLTDLLDLSKISAGNFPTQAQFFSLDTAIAHICTEFDSIASGKGLVIRQRHGSGTDFQVWFPPNRGIVAPKIHR